MTETEDLLTKYNVDSRNCRLRDYYEAEFEGITFYVTKEWGRGLKGRNFDGLLSGIKKDYPAFDVQEK